MVYQDGGAPNHNDVEQFEDLARDDDIYTYIDQVEETGRQSDRLMEFLTTSHLPGGDQTVLETLNRDEEELLDTIKLLTTSVREDRGLIGPADPSFLPTVTEFSEWNKTLTRLQSAIRDLSKRVKLPEHNTSQ